ncbi:DegT/DnrJ/EryC1/StrS family aminotransferase [Vibrio toranzoniae]|uniref:DegT/DnrJ/EryC1/StrS family aminotransferase n=1 Tax=Vibrio toranzoniae TaxID=1194427 RepID=UPI0013766576|nr:DegT/DnrJ/EryC1/StrS family aminotransferase [Vibrio toranzoniae]NAZ91666.1 aminotransferase class I/II-fold pyridoxal phosphate-dependent enzyme [Vibrio toranzoniae]
MIPVTKPFLPPLEEFQEYLEAIWESEIITNNGPYHRQLEAELCSKLGVKYVSLFNNGTIALITALKALEVTGEVITTPFSFVATAHSLVWNGITPVFADIEEGGFNIDATQIERLITERTTAIMPVHCYGKPCDVKKISEIADKHGLKVIYDAAHAFGVQTDNGSVLNFGDMSVVSFHATKVFNSFEGGAIICHSQEMKEKIDSLKNFGIEDEITVSNVGINGKMSEINSAFGLLQLKYFDECIEKRKSVYEFYNKELWGIEGIELPIGLHEKGNYSYYPIKVLKTFGISRDELYERLKKKGILSRRYFYPLISDMPMYRGYDSADSTRLPHAHSASEQVLCLPIYPSLTKTELVSIVSEISKVCI